MPTTKRSTANPAGHVRKPKTERTPPVFKLKKVVYTGDTGMEPLHVVNARLRGLPDYKGASFVFHHEYQRWLQDNRPSFVNGVWAKALDASVPEPKWHNPRRMVLAKTVTIHVNPDKSVTLLQQDEVMRWNAEKSKTYIKDETTGCRTMYKTSRGNLAFYCYSILRENTGEKRNLRLVHNLIDDINNDFKMMRWSEWLKDFKVNPQEEWLKVCRETFGEAAEIHNIYPGIELWGGYKGFTMLGTSMMRHDTPAKVARAMFGKKKYRKDLVKAIAKIAQESQSYNTQTERNAMRKLEWARRFKDIVPIDWIIQYLNTATEGVPAHEYGYDHAAQLIWKKDKIDDMRQAFDLFGLSAQEIKNILMTPHRSLDDTIRSVNQVLGVNADTAEIYALPANRDRIKSTVHWHDVWFAHYRAVGQRRRAELDAARYQPKQMWVNLPLKEPIAMAPKNIALIAATKTEPDMTDVAFRTIHKNSDWADGWESAAKGAGLDLRVARDYETLAGWSNTMSNCISSYFGQQSCYLAGVYEDDVLIANIEIREELPFDRLRNRYTSAPKFTVHQLLGKYNEKLHPDKREQIERVLMDVCDISIADRAWR